MKPELREAAYELIDSVYFDGADYSYKTIALKIGISERHVHTLFSERLQQNRESYAKKKAADLITKKSVIIEDDAQGRKELINGKICHVYPSRMNYENT